MARQDSRHRSPEKGRDADCTYYSEIGTVKINRPCYQNAWWTFAKEKPLWRTTSWKTLPGCENKLSKDTLKASLKDFNIPTETWCFPFPEIGVKLFIKNLEVTFARAFMSTATIFCKRFDMDSTTNNWKISLIERQRSELLRFKILFIPHRFLPAC